MVSAGAATTGAAGAAVFGAGMASSRTAVCSSHDVDDEESEDSFLSASSIVRSSMPASAASCRMSSPRKLASTMKSQCGQITAVGATLCPHFGQIELDGTPRPYQMRPLFGSTAVGHARTMRALSLPVVVVAAALAACPAEHEPRKDAGPVDDEPPGCVAASVGDLRLDAVEGDAGYDDELAALDVDALPDVISTASLSTFEIDLVSYMLEVDGTSLEEIDREEARATPLGLAVLGAFARAQESGAPRGELDFAFLRRGFHRFYACARGQPPTLDAFKRDVFDFTTVAPAQTIDSRVKGLRRRITRDAVAGAFIAETLLDDGSVRETEIILTDRRADFDLDFIEYDENGALRSASEFASAGGGQATGAVPFACIACHGYRDVSPPPPP